MNINNRLTIFIFTIILVASISACSQPARHGMVKDPETGLQYGSIIEKNIVIDAEQFSDKRVKVTLRNVSGDEYYDLDNSLTKLLNAIEGKGYIISNGKDYGIRFDTNVLYSGQIQKNSMREYGFLGAAAGGIAGYRSDAKAGEAIGILAGATLGSIIGSYNTEDTYIVVTEVTIGVLDINVGETKKVISFSKSEPLQEEFKSAIRPYEQVLRTKIAVFAGGSNVEQYQIADTVRQRIVRIISDII